MRTDLENDEYTIRPYKPGDEHAINQAFNEVFGLNRTIGEWENKFRAYGFEPRIMLVVDQNGRVVTQYASFQVPFEIDGRSFVVSQIVDVFSIRSRSTVSRQFFVKAANAFFETFCGPDGISALYGFPGPRAYRLGRHALKYRAVAPVTVWKTRLRSKHQPLLWVRSFWDRTETGLESHGPAVDRLWQEVRRLYPTGVPRDSRWLSERFFRRSADKYRTVFLRDGSGIRAWGVFAAEGRLASVVDLVWDGEDASTVRTVLSRIRHDARRSGARELQLWAPNHGPLAAVLRLDGWSCGDHPGGAIHTVRSFDGRVDEVAMQKGMFYSMGDSDLI